MTTKEFAQEAIKNGYSGNRCEGWDWIRANLQELDHLFRLKQYEAADGMKYKCMPYLLTDKTITELEKGALETAWFCNNERVHREKTEANSVAMIKDGYLPLTEEIVRQTYKNKKKLLVVAVMSMDWLTQKIGKVYKPFVDAQDTCWLMQPQARSRGNRLHQFENAFCKIV